jgi:RimJ/RimL family protein N-acetyltransferase
MIVREATLDDVPAYIDHMNRHFAESGQDGDLVFHPVVEFDTYNRQEQIAKTLEEWALQPPAIGWQKVWVALNEDGQIVADCLLRSGQMPATAHRAQFAIGIERAARGKGIGRTLSMLALSWAKLQKPPLRWVDLWVFTHNTPAIKLYEKLGFRKVDTVVDQFRVFGQQIDDTHMTLELL